jgi:hypothetical protein
LKIEQQNKWDSTIIRKKLKLSNHLNYKTYFLITFAKKTIFELSKNIPMMNPNKYLFFTVPFLLSFANTNAQDKRAILKTNLEQFDCHSGKYRLAKSGTDPIEKQGLS